MSKKSTVRIDPLTLALPPVGVDSHAHLDGQEFDADRDAVLERAHAAGIAQVGNVFLGPDDYHARRGLFDAHPNVFFIMGIHPCDGQNCTQNRLDAMRAAFAADARLKAVGEIGLDFYWPDCPREIQYQALRDQLALARAVQRPVVIHCREAEEETLMTLEAEGFAGYPLLWHCFGQGPEIARRILRNGWHISIPGPVTFPANDALRAALAVIPPDRLLAETDCPYLAPMPYRGKRNEPAYVGLVAAEIARIRGMAVEEVAEITTTNAKRVFGISEKTMAR